MMKTSLAVLGLFAASCGSLPVAAQDLPAGPGRETFKKVCTTCHDISSVVSMRNSRASWMNLVQSMKDLGAEASSGEIQEIVDYLTIHFGEETAAKKINVNKASAKELEPLGFLPKETEAIVAHRSKNGNFKDADSLMKVEGVDSDHIKAAKGKMEF